ncbi:hypothetical protein SMD22_00730 (plasmid) [Brevibacillus halotolerans]|nr:hypothetical protein SMD22_00730 [Brevibacillus halotolerans]
MIHFSPQDSEEGIVTYLVAPTDEAVYEWLKSDPNIEDGRSIFSGYADREEDVYSIYNENYDVIGTENFKKTLDSIKRRKE